MNKLIVGATESGKTSLGVELAGEFKKNGYGIIVLSAVYDPRWKADYYTEEPEDFLRVFWDSTQCVAFIDEAGETVGRYDEAMDKVATRGRHRQHSVFFILQKATRISLTVREQCSRAFIFQSAPSTCRVMSEEFNQPKIEERGPLLKRGEYIEVKRFGVDGLPYYGEGKVFEVKESVKELDTEEKEV
jgi:hypothetical protein